jgi:hypothetical protein
MHISDTVLECSRNCLRLAAKCTDDRTAVELHLLAFRLLLAAFRDSELVMEVSPAPPLACN